MSSPETVGTWSVFHHTGRFMSPGWGLLILFPSSSPSSLTSRSDSNRSVLLFSELGSWHQLPKMTLRASIHIVIAALVKLVLNYGRPIAPLMSWRARRKTYQDGYILPKLLTIAVHMKLQISCFIPELRQGVGNI
jgi:hypothetical protein